MRNNLRSFEDIQRLLVTSQELVRSAKKRLGTSVELLSRTADCRSATRSSGESEKPRAEPVSRIVPRGYLWD